jgi:hypothetical protein
MQIYQEILTQEDMNKLLNTMAGFHDSMTKEVHLINRGYVDKDHGMVMSHRFDTQILIQSQCKPFAVELVFSNISELNITDPGEYWGSAGSIEKIVIPTEKTIIRMSFDSSLTVSAEKLFYRIREEWLGQRAFLKSEVPSIDAIISTRINDTWRQCSSCCDAWEEREDNEFSLCPSCGLLTELKRG